MGILQNDTLQRINLEKKFNSNIRDKFLQSKKKKMNYYAVLNFMELFNLLIDIVEFSKEKPVLNY